MKKLLALLLVLCVCTASANSLEDLIEAMAWVESRQDSKAYNKKENAVGYLQIRPIMIREVNRLLEKEGSSTRYIHEHAWDKNCSEEIFRQWVRLNKYKNFQVMARNWNGGYRGINKASTLKYWRKIEKTLNRREISLR